MAHHKRYLTRENINDAGITLSWDNLEALCRDCHNKEHHKRKPRLRYKFDAAGGISPYPKIRIKGENTEGDTLKLPPGACMCGVGGVVGAIWQRSRRQEREVEGMAARKKKKKTVSRTRKKT